MSLVELRIQNLAVIQAGTLNFGSRFSVITGETGSGKSVCVEALKLALGNKADVDVVRSGSASATVSAVFDEMDELLAERLQGLGIPVDEFVTLTREVVRDGKSSGRINGASVSMTVLREAGEMLVEITGQGESHRLLKPGRQRDLLDGFGGDSLQSARSDFQKQYVGWKEIRSEVSRRQALIQTQAQAVDSAKQIVDELGALALRAGEEDGLRVRVQRLRNSAQLIAAANGLKDAVDQEEFGAEERLQRGTADIRKMATVDPAMIGLVASADAAIDQLRELSKSASRVAESIGVDEFELSSLETRMDAIERVKRRFGSVEAAIAELDRAKKVLDENDDAKSLGDLELKLSAASKEVATAAKILSGCRAVASQEMARNIEDRLHDLGLPFARFVVEVATDPETLTETGADEVSFLLSANKGGTPAKLDSGPSGGELSRLALALRAVVATKDDCPTLVLDEVDTGIGGESAARVGEVLSDIGIDRQVIAITHRAEIAARAQHHLEVSKQQSEEGATSYVGVVEGESRTREIARLLSGHPTEAALARAVELQVDGAKQRPRAPATNIA